MSDSGEHRMPDRILGELVPALGKATERPGIASAAPRADESGLHALQEQLGEMSESTIRMASRAVRESRKLRAAMAFAHALSVLGWKQREAAKHVGCDEKDIRHWLRAVAQPAWIPLSLPRAGYVAFLKKLADEAPPSERNGTYG